EDLAGGVFEPVVMGAAHELPRVAAALRHAGCLGEGQGVGLFGFSAGGAATLYALAEREVPVAAAVVLNASTGLSASVAAYERAVGKPFAWTPRARALAARSDAVERAADIAAGDPPPALLIVHGAEDTMLDGQGVHALHRALAPHYAGDAATRLQLSVVEELPHAARSPDEVARVRALAGDWFRRYLAPAGADTSSGAAATGGVPARKRALPRAGGGRREEGSCRRGSTASAYCTTASSDTLRYAVGLARRT